MTIFGKIFCVLIVANFSSQLGWSLDLGHQNWNFAVGVIGQEPIAKLTHGNVLT